ncbi:MAG: hypothetical protein MUE84_14560 [Hyphomonas sp.]|nr:hypothetical protein [Hyphomonas sp.]
MAQILRFPAATGLGFVEACRHEAFSEADAGLAVTPAAFRREVLAERRVYVAARYRGARIRRRRMHLLAVGLVAAIIATGASF